MAGPTVPIVYSVNFADPAGYFLATRVQMHNKDVIFAANAQSVEITKFATFLNTLISVPTNAVGLANTIQTNRILVRHPAHRCSSCYAYDDSVIEFGPAGRGLNGIANCRCPH